MATQSPTNNRKGGSDMRIEEAIEILDKMSKSGISAPTRDIADALKLGREALINFKVMRELIAGPDHKLLPGETEQ